MLGAAWAAGALAGGCQSVDCECDVQRDIYGLIRDSVTGASVDSATVRVVSGQAVCYVQAMGGEYSQYSCDVEPGAITLAFDGAGYREQVVTVGVAPYEDDGDCPCRDAVPVERHVELVCESESCATGGGGAGGAGGGASGGAGGGLVDGAYVVSPDGDDESAGTPAAPWRTIGKAAATLVAGDTVYIRAGTYAERLVPAASGGVDAVITYAAFPGEEPVLDGTGVALGDGLSGLVEIRGLGNIRVAGLRVVHAGSEDTHAGIIVIDSESIVIDRCRTYDTRSSGIGVWHSLNVTVRNNEVELACNDGSQECITISATDGFEVVGNHVHHGGPGTNGGEGIDTKESAANGVVHHNLVHDLERLGIYVDGWDGALHDVEVSSNVVHHASLGYAVAVENGGFAERVTFVNNVAYANRWAGLVVAGWGVDGASHAMADIAIVNNSFVGNGPGAWGPGIVLDNAAADRVLVRNNLLAHNIGEQMESPAIGAELVVDHNLFFGDGSSFGTDVVMGDPRLTDLATGDVHLLAGSAAIDVGSSAEAPATDLDGDVRPMGSGIDIGADEHAP